MIKQTVIRDDYGNKLYEVFQSDKGLYGYDFIQRRHMSRDDVAKAVLKAQGDMQRLSQNTSENSRNGRNKRLNSNTLRHAKGRKLSRKRRLSLVT